LYDETKEIVDVLMLEAERDSLRKDSGKRQRSGKRKRAWTRWIGIIVTWQEHASDLRWKVRDKDKESGKSSQRQTLKEEEA
jgi:hypothetical protein